MMTCPHADPGCSALYRDTVCLLCEIDAHEAWLERQSELGKEDYLREKYGDRP